MKSWGILLSALLFIKLAFGQSITNYKVFTGVGTLKKSKENVIILRQFSQNQHSFYFTVSPSSLKTSIIEADSIVTYSASWETLLTRFSNSPYILALRADENWSKSLQDAGITRFSPSQKGIDLTIDLCPSHLPLDRIVFNDLIRELSKIEKPVPVAISITGKWMNNHARDLKWLDSLQKAGDLNITWINHTFNHFTSKNVPLKENFILEPGTDINSEVLNLEIALLERNMVPSVFFRFPGLVSDKEIFDKIVDFGLIPVGSDAWLAKGQWPKNGSIVLIHANGNEPIGVHDFIILKIG